MKRCINTIVATIALSVGSYAVGSSSAKLYIIVPTTVGDNSIVRAIQQYSNITESYVNKWRPFGLWVIGSSLRSGVVDAINNYIKVCKSLKLAHYKFPDEESLRAAFPINWTLGALCMALRNLKEQGMNALALVGQVNGDDVQGLDAVIASYLSIIDHNRNVLKAACTALVQKRAEKQAEAVKLALDEATINEKRSKSWADKFNVLKTINVLMDPSSSAALLGLYYFAAKIGSSNTSNSVKE
jgi:hypothetical protein